MNGTVTLDKDGDVRGKIVVTQTQPPVEIIVRELQHKGAAAVIFARVGTFQPGFSMYVVTGKSRSDLWLPVMEATFPPGKHILKLPEGSFVQCIPTENLHKRAYETKFQLIMNLILSFWEIAIIVIACHRIYQFYFVAHSPLLSIAPLCCTLEAIAAALRLAYTLVDPFFTYRMLRLEASNVLITVSWPFSESAGILLTFFCTYTSLPSLLLLLCGFTPKKKVEKTTALKLTRPFWKFEISPNFGVSSCLTQKGPNR